MNKYILIFLTLFLTNCGASKEQDLKNAEKVTQKFYILLKENDREGIFKLYGSELFKVASKEQINRMFDISFSQFGNIKNESLIYEQTNVLKDANFKNEYILIYNVTRDIKNTQEKFTLHKDGDSIKIVGYFINPDNNQ